jgi:hypothetical protein
MNSLTAGGLFVIGNPLGDNSMYFTGSKALIMQAVGLLTYSPSAGHTGDEIVTFNVNDNGNLGAGGALAANAMITITTGAMPNTPPTIGGIATMQTYVENGSSLAIFAGITIADTQQTNIALARVISGGAFDPLEDRQPKLLASPGGIFATRSGNVLTLLGSFPIADYVAALSSLQYSNSSESPSTAARTFSVEVFDGTSWSALATTSVSVVSVDDPMELSLPVTSTVNFGQTLLLAGSPSTLYLLDLDAGATQYEMTVSAIHGVASINGATPAQQVAIRGPINALNDLLQMQFIAYTPNIGFQGVDVLSVVIRGIDTNTGVTLPAGLANQVMQITVLAGVPPVLVNGETKAYFTEDLGPVTLHPSVQIAGGNNGVIDFATVQIIGGYNNLTDTLIASKVPAGMNAIWNESSATLTFTGAASIASYELALSSVAYNNNSQNPSDEVRQISMFVADSLQQSTDLLIEVVVQTVNDTPSLLTPNNLSIIEDSRLAFALTNAIKADDVDSDQLVLTISIENGELNWVGVLGLPTSARVINPAQIELSGNAADINQLAAQFEFVAPSNFNGMSKVKWTLLDNQGASVTQASTLQVTAVNDVPTWQSLGLLGVEQGSIATISQAQTQAQDIEDDAAQLAYLLNAMPIHGSLEMNGATLNLGASFTQADIDSGALKYKHDNSVNASDSFSFSVRDSAGASTVSNTVAIVISVAPVIVVSPTGGGNTGGGTTGGVIITPPVITASPSVIVDAKSSDSVAASDQLTTSGASSPNSVSNTQSKALVRSASNTASNTSSNDNQSDKGLSSLANSSLSNTIGSATTTTIGPTGPSALTKSNTDDIPKSELSLASGLLRVRSVAENTEYAAILRSALGNQTFNDDVQNLRNENENIVKFNQNVVASTTAVSATLSIGYVIWLVRGGALLSSLLASIPAWSLVDPLPILGSMGGDENNSDDESLDEMIKKSQSAREKAAELTTPQPELQA